MTLLISLFAGALAVSTPKAALLEGVLGQDQAAGGTSVAQWLAQQDHAKQWLAEQDPSTYSTTALAERDPLPLGAQPAADWHPAHTTPLPETLPLAHEAAPEKPDWLAKFEAKLHEDKAHALHTELHDAVHDIHAKVADVLDAAPAPPGPSSHAARFAKLLDALQSEGHSPLAAAHLEAERPAETIEQSTQDLKAEDAKAAAVLAAPEHTAGPRAWTDWRRPAAVDADEAEEAETALAPANEKAAAEAPPDAESVKDYTAKSKAPQEPEPKEGKAEVAKEAEEMKDEVETAGLRKLGQSLKTMTLLHLLMQPMLTKLHAAAESMPPAAREHARETMAHLQALDALSVRSTGLMHVVKDAAGGTPEEKQAAIEKLETGLLDIKTQVAAHMAALKAARPKPPATLPFASKLQGVVRKMQARVDAELATNPNAAHDPLVAIDVQLLQAMKGAVAKSEALVFVAAQEIERDPAHKEQFQHALKTSLEQVTLELKKEMDGFKAKAMLLMLLAKAMHEHKEHPGAAADAPADAEPHASGSAEEEAPPIKPQPHRPNAPQGGDGDGNAPDTDSKPDEQLGKMPKEIPGLTPNEISHAPAERVPKEEEAPAPVQEAQAEAGFSKSNAALASLESWMHEHESADAAQAAEATSLAQAVKKMANLRHD